MKIANFLLGKVIIGLILGMVILFSVIGIQTTPIHGDLIVDTVAASKLEINSRAPDFRLKSLKGEDVNLIDFVGKTVILNFWASWCGPCREEMPVFQKKVNEFSEELLILTVNSQDSAEDAQLFLDELYLSLNVLLDDSGEVHKKYLVRGVPTTYIVDPDGILRIHHVGIITEGQLDDYLSTIGLRN
jgi:cytochrome c biogenesis protein CcmG/thiol:disulfide interchange protein DsbE